MPHDAFPPLRLADDASLRPGVWERRWAFFPVAGWMVAAALGANRIQSARVEVRQQLARRRYFAVDAWRIAGLPSDRAEAVCQIIAPCFAMPNHFFLPEDPITLLLLDQDGIGAIKVAFDIEKQLGVSLRGKRGRFDGTLGDFVRKFFA